MFFTNKTWLTSVAPLNKGFVAEQVSLVSGFMFEIQVVSKIWQESTVLIKIRRSLYLGIHQSLQLNLTWICHVNICTFLYSFTQNTITLDL